MSDLDNAVDLTVEKQAPQPSALDHAMGVISSLGHEAARNVQQFGEGTGRGLYTAIPYVVDVLEGTVKGTVNSLLARNPHHPVLGFPDIVPAVETKGPNVQGANEAYDSDQPNQLAPVNEEERLVSAAGQGVGSTAFGVGSDLASAVHAIVGGVAGGVSAEGAHVAFPHSDIAPVIAGFIGGAAGAGGSHILSKGGDLVAAGKAYPEYSALADHVIPSNEGGGSVEHPLTNATSGAEGPMQVMAATKAKPGLGVRPSDGTEADTVREGKDYLAALLGKYEGDPQKAMAAYDWGEGHVDRAIKKYGEDNWLQHAPDETINYVSKGMIKLRGVSGQEPIGSVPPISPEQIASALNDPEAAGLLSEVGKGETPSEATPEGLEQQVSQDMAEASRSVNDNIHSNEPPPMTEDDQHELQAADQNYWMSRSFADAISGKQSYQDAAKVMGKIDAIRDIRDNIQEGLDNDEWHPAVAAKYQDTLDNLNKVIDAADKDPTADKPVVDNTGYEKFTPNPQDNTPANDAFKDFTEVKTDPDGTKYINYTSKAGDTIPIKLGIEPDGMAEIAIDQFGTGANKLGPAEVRSAMNTLMKMYPDIKGFGGFRRSGAGTGRVQEVFPNAGGGGKEPPIPPSGGDGGFVPPEPPKGNGEEPGKYAGSINLDRMGISEAAKDSLRTMAPPVGSDIKTFPETRAAAHKLIDEKGVEGVLNMKTVAPQDLDHYALAVRQINATAQEHLVKVNEDILNPETNSDAAKARWQYALKIAADATDRNQIISKASGRLQGSLRIKAEGGYTLLGDKVSKAMKLNLPDEEVAQLIKEAPDKAAKIAKDAMTPGFADYMRSYYYNVDLLSRPTTLEHVFGGNLLINTAEDIAHLFAAFIDTPMKLLGSKDAVTFHEVYSRLLGHAVGVAKAFTTDPATGMSPFAQAWKEHRPLDWTERTGTYDLIKGPLYPLSVFGRSISAIDELSRNWTRYASIYGQASRQAFKDGFSGQDFKDRFNDLVNNPSASIVKQADIMAKAGRLQDTPSPVGKWLQGALHSNKPELSIPATILFPFVRMMDASMRLSARYTPGVGMLDRYNQADFSKGLAGKSLVASRTLIGAGLMYTVVQKVLNGQLTGLGPTDPSKRKQWLATHQPESLKVGDKWYSYSWLPFAPLVSGTASATERLNGPQAKGSDYGATVTSAIMGFAHGMTAAGWAGALSDLFDVFEDNGAAGIKKIESWAGKTAAGVAIPGLVQKADQIIDPVHRDTYQHPFVDQIKGVTPGLSQSLPPQHDVYGNVITREGGLSQLVNPFNEKTIPKGDGYKALDKLAAEVPDSVVTSDEHTIHGKKLTEAGYQKYQAYSGRLFRQMMAQNMGEFQSASNKDKVTLVKQTLREARAQARQDLWGM